MGRKNWTSLPTMRGGSYSSGGNKTGQELNGVSQLSRSCEALDERQAQERELEEAMMKIFDVPIENVGYTEIEANSVPRKIESEEN